MTGDLATCEDCGLHHCSSTYGSNPSLCTFDSSFVQTVDSHRQAEVCPACNATR